MKRLITIVLIAATVGLLAGATGLWAQDAAEPAVKIQVVGLSVARHDGSNNKTGTAARMLSAGTSVYFLADFGDRTAIEILEGDSRLEAFTDNTGAVLLEAGKAKRFGFVGMTRSDIADDGKTATFCFSALSTPTKGATAVQVKANVAFLLGAKVTTATADNVTVKADESFPVGDWTLKITKAGKPQWGDGKMEIELETNQEVASIKAFRFFNAAGEEVESRFRSSSEMTMGGKSVYTRSFALDEALETMTLKLDYYAETETVTAAIDVTVGPGL